MNVLKKRFSFPLNFENNIAIVWKNKKHSYNDRFKP